MHPKAIRSEDGSITFRLPELDETYHSLDGAISESRHVYIEHGLNPFSRISKDFKVFELGFGMGYNAILSALTATELGLKIEYTTIEPYPISWETLEENAVKGSFEDEGLKYLFEKIHRAEWNEEIKVSENFILKKIDQTIEEFEPAKWENTGVVYFDAFAPSRQPKVWEKENLEKSYQMLSQNGILTTYCSQGKFKRDLESVGFEVKTVKGFGKKREMTVAIKN